MTFLAAKSKTAVAFFFMREGDVFKRAVCDELSQ